MYILNEDQKDLVNMAKQFAEKEIRPIVAEYDRKGEFPTKVYEKAMEIGFHVLELPEEFGGSGLDLTTIAAMYEQIAMVDAGVATSLMCNGLAWKPVAIGGTDEQKQYFADHIVPGGFACFGLTESDAGSDVSSMRTTAERNGDEYVLNGSKCFITNGGVSNIAIIFAVTDKSKGAQGISAFMVETNTPGFSVGKEEDKMGIRLSNTVEIVLDNVVVPASNRLGKEGTGFLLAMKALDLARPMMGICAVGLCQHALNEAVEYAKIRKCFGKPIGKFQGLQFMIADMAIATETARQMVAYSLKQYEAGCLSSVDGAICKCYCGDSAVKVAVDAIQIFGGYGYSREYPVEKLLRDAKIFQIFEGTNQIQRMVIAGGLLAGR